MDSNFNLNGLLSLVDRWDGLPSLLARLGGGERVAVAPVEGAKSYLLAALAHRLGVPVLVITARPGRAREMQEQIAGWSGLPGRVLLFPEPDALPYERMPEDPSTTAARLQAMSELAAWHGSRAAGDEPPPYVAGLPPVVVTSGRAMMERIMPPRDLARSVTRLKVGDRVPWQATQKRWMELGYEPVPVVEAPGSFSRRGGILDLYPPGSPSPFRIELFGDDIESIRLFDPATQRSTEKTAEVVITPPHELLPPSGPGVLERLLQLDLSSCTPQARERLLGEMAWLEQSVRNGDGERGRGGDAGKDPLITHDSSLITRPLTPNPQPLTPDLGFYRPLLSESTLLDYLPEGGLLVLDDPSQIAAVTGDLWEQSLHLQIQAVERGEIPSGLPPALVSWDSRVEKLPAARTGILEMRYDPGAEELPFEAPPSYGGKVKLVLDDAVALADGGTGRGDEETRRRGEEGNVGRGLVPRRPGPGRVRLLPNRVPGTRRRGDSGTRRGTHPRPPLITHHSSLITRLYGLSSS